MWSFIARTNLHGFWRAWLSTTADRLAFLERLARSRYPGDPAWTWSDVEREIRNRIRDQGLIPAYCHQARLVAQHAVHDHTVADVLDLPAPMQPRCASQLGLL